MSKLSKRLSRHEFACKCGCGFAAADQELVRVLENVANQFHLSSVTLSRGINRVVLYINSGCRCINHDAAIKDKTPSDFNGKPLSKHVLGIAADFRLEWCDNTGARTKVPDDDIADYLIKRYPGKYGIGRYNGRTHIDMRDTPARWDNR